MRRTLNLSLLLVPLLIGCGQKPDPKKPRDAVVVNDESGARKVVPVPDDQPGREPRGPSRPRGIDEILHDLDGPSDQDRYEEALLEAIGLSAERKYADALTALQKAQKVQDTQQVRQEIERVKGLLDRQTGAETTLRDIEAVLRDGRAEEAAKLAADALQQFGDGELADRFLQVKRQADALLTLQKDDTAQRRAKFLDEGKAALEAKNLRAAVLAFEQALALEDDAALRKQYDELSATTRRHDELREKAAQLRKDPGNLEDALAALEEARKAWDTPAVRQEIADCNLALQVRRDRLAVAEFEVRGDVGIPAAGRFVAERLLPGFKSRYDLIERDQIDRVVEELKLDGNLLDADEAARREVGRLSRARYLVVGSITAAGGISVHARLIDVRTGLIVQTGTLPAVSAKDLDKLLPRLAALLQLSDEKRMEVEQELAREAAQAVKAADPPADLPAAPEPVGNGPRPDPIVTRTFQPPALGEVAVEDFDRLPAPPAVLPAAPPVIVLDDTPFRRRLLFVSIEVGDNLFRWGRYAEASRHYEFALSLSPGHRDIALRLDRCRPHLPPVVILPARPRVAIVNFLVRGNPRVVSPALGAWTPDRLALYLSHRYEVIDRDELAWYMHRLGLTVRDLMRDPGSRRYLARVLGVRYFVFGTIRETASFDVTTHFVDAEWGYEHGRARLHCHDYHELKLRLPELARLTVLGRDDYRREIAEHEKAEKLLIDAHKSYEKGHFSIAIDVYKKALGLRPNSVEIAVLLQRSERRQEQAALELARRKELERQEERRAERDRRETELKRAAEAARREAERRAASQAEAERRAEQDRRDRAYLDLIARGDAALRRKEFHVSIQLFQSAIGLKKTEEGDRLLALARARADEAARARVAEAEALRERELRRKREEELERVRAKLDEERKQREAEAKARKDREQRDEAVYERLIDEAEKLLAKKKFDEAIASLQTARQLRNTPQVNKLLSQALGGRADETAKDEKEKKELERRRAEAAELARKKQAHFDDEMREAGLKLKQKKYDEAIAHYEEAVRTFPTDAAQTALRNARQERDREKARADAEILRQKELVKRDEEVKKLLDAAHENLATSPGEAVQLLLRAKKLHPTHPGVQALLAQAEKAQEAAAAKARKDREERERKAAAEAVKKDAEQREARLTALIADARKAIASGKLDDAERFLGDAAKIDPKDTRLATVRREIDQARKSVGAIAEFNAAMKAGRTALQASRHEEAVKAFTEAVRLRPDDAEAKRLRDQAAKELEKVRRDEEERKKAETEKRQQFAKALQNGKTALEQKRYEEAVKGLREAVRLDPKDAEAARVLRQAEQALDAEKKKAEDAAAAERMRKQAFQKALTDGRTAHQAKRYEEAVQALREALRLQPNEPEATNLLRAAEKALDDARKAREAEERRKQDEAKQRQAYTDAMAKGRAAMGRKAYAEAIQQFREALKLMPGDKAATEAIADAQRLLDDKKPTPPPGGDFDKLLKQADDAAKRGNYAQAVQAYRDALKVKTGDRDATAGMRFADAMADGIRLHQARKFKEAEDRFNEALKAKPGDRDAQNWLKRARDKK